MPKTEADLRRETSFEVFEVKELAGVDRVLSPLIVPLVDGSSTQFLTLGGFRGNFTRHHQVCSLELQENKFFWRLRS